MAVDGHGRISSSLETFHRALRKDRRRLRQRCQWLVLLQNVNNLQQLRRRERSILQSARVLLHLCDRLEPGDRDERLAPAPQPTERTLRERPPVRGQYVADRLQPAQRLGLVTGTEVPPVPYVVRRQRARRTSRSAGPSRADRGRCSPARVPRTARARPR